MSSGIRQSLTRTRYSLNLQKNFVRLELQIFERPIFNKALPEILSSKRPRPLHFIRCKAHEFMQWYEEFSGLNEVREAQARVVEAGDKFVQAQEERRLASLALADVEKRLKALHAELDNTKRGDERYLFLITEEHKLLKEEETNQENFMEAERAEREQFTILSNSVKNSHEKERNQAEKTKYWSIIGSIIGTIIGIIGTSINNHFKIAELKSLIHQSSTLEMKEQLKTCAENSERIMDKISKLGGGGGLLLSGFNGGGGGGGGGGDSVDSADSDKVDKSKPVEDVLQSISCKLDDIVEAVEKMREDIKTSDGIIRFDSDSDSEEESGRLGLQFSALTETIERESTDIKCFIVSASIFCLVVVIIAKIIQS